MEDFRTRIILEEGSFGRERNYSDSERQLQQRLQLSFARAHESQHWTVAKKETGHLFRMLLVFAIGSEPSQEPQRGRNRRRSSPANGSG